MRTVRMAARAAKVLGGLILGAELALLAGCAGPRVKGPAPDRVQLEVPFFTDAASRGADATLAEVLTFWDQPTEPKELSEEVGTRQDLPSATDALPAALLLAAEDHGMQARSFQASIQDVRQELELGHPVVAFLNLGPAILAGDRYVVITGFDDGRGGFFVNAAGANRFVSYNAFMSRWEKTGRWAILVLPAGEPTMSDRTAGSGL